MLRPTEVAQRRTAVMVRIVRAAFIVLMVTFALLAALQQQQSDKGLFGGENRGWTPVIVAVGVAFMLVVAAIAIDLATPKKKISTITGVLLGIISGVLATAALGFIIDLLLESWMQNKDALDVVKPVANSLKVLIGITLSYIGTVTVLQTQDDFRLVIPYVEFAKQIRGVRPLLLDTSVLIDGRIADVAATGFLQAPLIIPRFVVLELQALADSADAMKRARGRRGLELVTRLQRLPKVDVSIEEAVVPGAGVDQMLVELARLMPAVVVTADVALGQVARINGVGYLNFNDLANCMKGSLVPGETITISLLRAGEQAGQAVGYLPDGAMVVCENGSNSIGQNVSMVVQSSLQTSAGRLIFARIPAPTHLAPDTSNVAGNAALLNQQPPEDLPVFSPANPPQKPSGQPSAQTQFVPSQGAMVAEDSLDATSPAHVPSPAPQALPSVPAQPPTSPAPAASSSSTSAPAQPSGAAADGPFPPTKVFRPTRPGTPRNPRR